MNTIKLDKNELSKYNDMLKVLILGNGSSMYIWNKLGYKNLLSKLKEKYTPNEEIDKKIIEKLEKQENYSDIENFLKYLDHTKELLEILKIQSYQNKNGPIEILEKAQNSLRDHFFDTISKEHPDFNACGTKTQNLAKIINKFDVIINLNYDLFSYWGMNQLRKLGLIEGKFTDGFCINYGNNEENDLFFDGFKKYPLECGKLIIRPHGALHIYEELHNIKKMRWNESNSILSQVKEHVENLVLVLEGENKKKLASIMSNDYLRHIYNEILPNLGSYRRHDAKKVVFFSYGWSMNDQDEHILNQLIKNDFSKMYISVYAENAEKERTIDTAEKEYIDHIKKCYEESGKTFDGGKIVFFEANDIYSLSA